MGVFPSRPVAKCGCRLRPHATFCPLTVCDDVQCNSTVPESFRLIFVA